jgi:hypothetical protein
VIYDQAVWTIAFHVTELSAKLHIAPKLLLTSIHPTQRVRPVPRSEPSAFKPQGGRAKLDRTYARWSTQTATALSIGTSNNRLTSASLTLSDADRGL